MYSPTPDSRSPTPFRPKVTDFGVARGDSNLTGTSIALGTPEYMAPEQASGQSAFVGPAVDIYAMGVVTSSA